MDNLFPESENQNSESLETPAVETDEVLMPAPDDAEIPAADAADTAEKAPDVSEDEACADAEPADEATGPENDPGEEVSGDETAEKADEQQPDEPADEPEATEEPARERPREEPSGSVRSAPRRRRTKPEKEKKSHGGLIALGVILILLISAALSLNFIITPTLVADKFIEAMESRDLKLLSLVTEARGEIELTAENTAPFFALYDSDVGFRKNVNDSLAADSALIKKGKMPLNDEVVDIRVMNFYLFKLYRISVATSDIVIYTNFNGAKVALNDTTKIAYSAEGYNYNAHGLTVSDDYFDFVRSKAVFDGVLPGNYSVNVTYLSSKGETFTSEGFLEFTAEENEFALDLEFEQMEIINSTEFDVDVTVGDGSAEKLPAGGTLKAFPLKAGETVTVFCDTGNEMSLTRTLVAGEDESCELSFAEVNTISTNQVPVDFYVNGEKRGTIPASAGEYRIYPVSIGDEIEFKVQNASFDKMLMPLKMTAGESEEATDLTFHFRKDVYSGVDEIVKQDIVSSFEIINAAYTMDELKEMILEHKTLAELIEYADYESAGMYSTLSEPQVTIDLDSCSAAHIVDNKSPKISVDAEIIFNVGYHEKDKPAPEEVEKYVTITYTLAYVNGAWSFEPAESLII